MAEHLKDLADFVRERGGGLLMIAGERFAPHAYKDSPLRDVLPIELTADEPATTGRRAARRGLSAGADAGGPAAPDLPLQPRREGERGDLEPAARDVLVVGRLPAQAGGGGAGRPSRSHAKAGRASTGATGDGFRATSSRWWCSSSSAPGRCMFFGFNETWRWGFREDQLHFNQFWIQTVRYLARSRLGRIELRLDRQTPYRRGEPIKVTVRFPDDAPPPAAGHGGEGGGRAPQPGHARRPETLQLTKLEGSRATYETVLTQTPEGEYKFWLSQPTGARPQAAGRVQGAGAAGRDGAPAHEPGRDGARRRGDARPLLHAGRRRAAARRPADRQPRDGQRAGPPWLVWNYFVLFVLAVGALTTEWLLRKQKNLL